MLTMASNYGLVKKWFILVDTMASNYYWLPSLLSVAQIVVFMMAHNNLSYA